MMAFDSFPEVHLLVSVLTWVHIIQVQYTNLIFMFSFLFIDQETTGGREK